MTTGRSGCAGSAGSSSRRRSAARSTSGGCDQYAGGLFVPLRDGTAGSGSYGAGRYLLDTAKGAWLGGDESALVLDLNFAYHPSCRYDDRWRCPLAPAGNTIPARVEAGERL